MWTSLTEFRRRWVYLNKKINNFTWITFHLANKWSNALFHDIMISFCISHICANKIQLGKWKWFATSSSFIPCIRIWTKRDVNVRIYSGTGDKWCNITIISSIKYITSPGLFYNPDSTTEAGLKYPHTRLAQSVHKLDCSIVPNCASLDLFCDSKAAFLWSH